MTEFLIYDLKVAALIAVFYMFYRLLLSRDPLHRQNRMVLLTTAVASFILPLCVITMHETVVVNAAAGHIGLGGLRASVEDEPPLTWWQVVLPVVYIIGMAATLAHTLVSVLKVWLLIRSSEQHPCADGITLCVTGNADVSPFSWMHYIVISRSDHFSPPSEGAGDGGRFSPPSEGSGEALILAHERGHIRQHHSLDVLLVDTLTALQWFNPAMWMLRQDLRDIHEYEADAAVLSQGINMRQYQYLLIQKAAATCGYSVANGITHSTLKNRITMMLNNKKSSRRSMFKPLALLPVVGIALALNAETVTDYVYEDTQSQPVKKMMKKGRKDGQIKLNGQTIEVKTDTGTYKGVNVHVTIDKEYLKEPLVIIDGRRATKEQMQALDSETIDHIDVLKDKASTEVYGEDGKNGVIIITTVVGNASQRSNDLVGNASQRSDNDVILNLGNAKVDSTGIQEVVVADVVEPGFEKVFDVVEQMPEFPGGPEALMQFLAANVCYPEAAFKTGAQGRVLVQFIVDTEGRVNNAKVVKKVNDDLDAEAIRVIGSMPRWKPGMQSGKAVRVKYTLPITFRLE